MPRWPSSAIPISALEEKEEEEKNNEFSFDAAEAAIRPYSDTSIRTRTYTQYSTSLPVIKVVPGGYCTVYDPVFCCFADQKGRRDCVHLVKWPRA